MRDVGVRPITPRGMNGKRKSGASRRWDRNACVYCGAEQGLEDPLGHGAMVHERLAEVEARHAPEDAARDARVQVRLVDEVDVPEPAARGTGASAGIAVCASGRPSPSRAITAMPPAFLCAARALAFISLMTANT